MWAVSTAENIGVVELTRPYTRTRGGGSETANVISLNVSIDIRRLRATSGVVETSVGCSGGLKQR